MVCYVPKASRGFCPAGHILVLVPRFDREFVPTFQRHGSVGDKNGTQFEMNFVFHEGLCLHKSTSPKIICPGRTAHHPSCHMKRQVSESLSFKQILARFSKCSPQMTGQILFKFDFKFPTLSLT